jgi:hypothetical protein
MATSNVKHLDEFIAAQDWEQQMVALSAAT